MEKNKKRNRRILQITLGILLMLLVFVAGTYAYWQLTKTQSESNNIISACLDFDMSDVTDAINLENVYPMSESDIDSLTGYTFKVRNHCEESINYVIGLSSTTNYTNSYLDNDSVRLKLDNNLSKIYGSLNDIEYNEAVRYSKEIGYSTIEGNSENTHILKVWIDEFAPITEQGKSFTGKVFITGGQGIEPLGEVADSCFMISNEGTILSYNYDCGTDVVVPSEINGIRVKKISAGAFAGDVLFISAGNDCYDDKGIVCNTIDMILLIKDTPKKTIAINNLKEQLCPDPSTCTLDDVETIITSEISGSPTAIITSMEEYNAYDFNNYEHIEKFGMDSDTMLSDFESRSMLAKTLDLSNAIYLEEIEESAFYEKFNYYSDELTEDNCESSGTQSYKHAYYCTSDRGLTSLTLPQNGMLTTIGDLAFASNKITGTLIIPSGIITLNSAFTRNEITKLVIPGSVTSIEKEAFEGNPLSEVIIKRASAEGITISPHAFPIGITPIFNPNYTE